MSPYSTTVTTSSGEKCTPSVVPTFPHSPPQSQKSSRYSMERFIASRGNVAAVADEKEAEHVGAESWGAA